MLTFRRVVLVVALWVSKVPLWMRQIYAYISYVQIEVIKLRKEIVYGVQTLGICYLDKYGLKLGSIVICKGGYVFLTYR